MLIKRSAYRYVWWPDGSTEKHPVGSFDLFDDEKHPHRPLSLWSFGIHEEKNYGKGYGQQMLNEAIAMAGNRDIELYVICTNKVALHIYEKAGFEIVGQYNKHSYALRMLRKVKSINSTSGINIERDKYVS